MGGCWWAKGHSFKISGGRKPGCWKLRVSPSLLGDGKAHGEQCSCVWLKVEFISKKIRYLAEESSQQCQNE